MCRALAVSRSGYYAWRDRRPSERSQANERLVARIRQIYHDARCVYGAPRIHAELRAQQVLCGRHRVARLMRKHQIRARQYRRRRNTTDSRHQLPVAVNLLQQDFHAQAANQKWVADITYISTAEGWLYLAAVVDLFSRRVVGWSMQSVMTAELVIEAQQMAFATRQPGQGLLQHTDRGSQYASDAYQRLLRQQQTTPSMSGRGNCYDNAAMESFFHTLKTELVAHCRWQTRQEARLAIFEYIEVFYNRQRRHSSLGYRSPVEFEIAAAHNNVVCPP
jgi:transposase InsO family protein